MLKLFLFSLLTVVEQKLAFATTFTPHKEINPAAWKKYNGYEPVVIETHIIESKWRVELIRFENPNQFKKVAQGISSSIFSMLGESTQGNVYYHVKINCVPNVCSDSLIKTVNIRFDYFESGTPPNTISLRNVTLGSYTYFYEEAPAISIIVPSLEKIQVSLPGL